MQRGQKNSPKFSILLPTHNRADVLPFAIRSVLAQTLQDFELLIVGDGCTDQTAEVVRSFSDARISWFDLPKAPNFGYANRNIALRQTRGTYIAFMAHDDLWLPDHLELLYPFLDKPGIELAYSRPLWVIPEGMIIPGTFNLENETTLRSFLAKEKNEVPAGCVVHRRECFDKYGYWNDTLHAAADWDMWARIILGGGRKNFAYLAEPTCLHFRANWRMGVNFLQEHEIVWEKFHALAGFIPSALKISVARGIPDQEAVWQAMSVDPQNWSKQVRMGILQVLDQRVSQSNELIGALLRREPSLECDAASLNKRIAELFERQASLEQHVASLNKRIAELLERQASLEQYIASLNEPLITGSLMWRLVRGLRALKRRIIPSGSLREKLWLHVEQNLKRVI